VTSSRAFCETLCGQADWHYNPTPFLEFSILPEHLRGVAANYYVLNHSHKKEVNRQMAVRAVYDKCKILASAPWTAVEEQNMSFICSCFAKPEPAASLGWQAP